MTLDSVAQAATIFGAVLAAAGVFYAGVQLHASALIAKGQFLLELTKMFAEHDPIHVKLRPGGEWRGGQANPSGPDDWAAIDAYLGLFERCEVLIRQKSLDPIEFSNLFGYRLDNILSQPAITGKKFIGGERQYWANLIALLDRMQLLGKLQQPWPLKANEE